MPDRFWVGADSDWHTIANWSTVTGGAGGAGVPTASDDVFIDGNGFALCWATAPIVCNNLTLLVGTTESLLLDQGGVINGDFEEQAGYFGPTGGGGYTVEFKGNWLFTGGTFAVGTGTGRDPTCEFSGTGKTYVLNHTGTASYQHVLMSGSYTLSGTKLSLMSISQEFVDVSGSMTISSGNRIDLRGSWEDLTGTIDGDGYLVFEMDAAASVPVDGTLDVDVELYLQATVTQPARRWGGDVDVIYEADNIAFRLGAGKHYFDGYYKTTADDAAITTGVELDCATYGGEFRCTGVWSVDQNSFKQPAAFTLNWGAGTVHVFHDNFQLGVFGAATSMVMDASDTTIILHPTKNKAYTYRLSRVVGGFPGTYDEQTWNRIYLLRTQKDSVTSIRFVEGFVCHDGRFEIWNPVNASVRFRDYNLLPQHSTEFDRLTVIGINETGFLFGWPVLTGFGSHTRINVNDRADIFGVTIAKLKCTPTVDAYNSELWVSDGGRTSGVNFHDRDVRRIPGQRNVLNSREKLTPSPPPELIIEQLLEVVA